MKLRTGRRLDKNLYLQLGPEPSDDDPLVGQMQDNVLAKLVVQAVEIATWNEAAPPLWRTAWKLTGREIVEREDAERAARREELGR